MIQHSSTTRAVLLAAVVPATAHRVLHEATSLAAALNADVVAVHVDPSRYVIGRHLDGTVDSVPIDPDADDAPDPHALDTLRQVTDAHTVDGRPVTLWPTAGYPPAEIAHLAAHLNARIIIVGTRRPGLAHHVVEFFTGSVAAHLTHRQTRPVLIVPISPGSFADPAPWENPAHPTTAPTTDRTTTEQ